MFAIHSYQVVHEEPVPGTPAEVLLLLYDQLKGGMFYVLLPKGWALQDIMPHLEYRRKRRAFSK
jgi:hypothetical protein